MKRVLTSFRTLKNLIKDIYKGRNNCWDRGIFYQKMNKGRDRRAQDRYRNKDSYKDKKRNRNRSRDKDRGRGRRRDKDKDKDRRSRDSYKNKDKSREKGCNGINGKPWTV